MLYYSALTIQRTQTTYLFINKKDVLKKLGGTSEMNFPMLIKVKWNLRWH